MRSRRSFLKWLTAVGGTLVGLRGLEQADAAESVWTTVDVPMAAQPGDLILGTVQAAFPAAPAMGELCSRTDLDAYAQYDGVAWALILQAGEHLPAGARLRIGTAGRARLAQADQVAIGVALRGAIIGSNVHAQLFAGPSLYGIPDV